jgi:hypothetical protein
MPDISSDALAQLSALSRSYRDAEIHKEKLEEQLKECSATIRTLREEDIPALMAELQLTEIKLETGEKISIVPEVYASIPVERREEAYGWLEEHGFGGLIKTEVLVAFGKEQLDKAKALAEQLVALGFVPELSRWRCSARAR